MPRDLPSLLRAHVQGSGKIGSQLQNFGTIPACIHLWGVHRLKPCMADSLSYMDWSLLQQLVVIWTDG
jgi:hypothetical protein